MPKSPMRQTGFQWFADDAPPSSSSPLQSERSNLAAVPPGAHMLLRVQSQHTGRHSFSIARQLQYRKVGTNAWRSLSAFGSPPYDMPFPYPSTWFADGDPITTQRLSTPRNASEDDFVGGEARQSELVMSSLGYGAQHFSEDLWSLLIHPMAPEGLDLEFRVTADGEPFEEYDLYPRLTVEGYVPSEMDVKANQLLADARPLAELHFRRDETWWDLSDRLLFPFTITRRLRCTTTADLMLDNSDGMLARDNRVSSWNYDVSSAYDPLLDEGRVIRLRQGVELHPNAAYGLEYGHEGAAPTRPASVRGTELSDGGFGQTANEADDAWVGWQGVEATVVFTLSPARDVKAVAASLLTRTAAAVSLPGSATVTLIGSAGDRTAPLPLDHLRDDPAGRRQYVYGLDLDQASVSRVVFRFRPKSGEDWIQLDEVAIYDASTTAEWLKTTFTGMLGDEIRQDADDRGVVHLEQARDMTKRLADLFVELFDHYADMPVESIVEDLLTNPRYEAALEAADYCLDATSFVLPKWTEQNASVLDACVQLAKMIGWVLEADDEGIYTLHDLDWTAQSGEETYVADRGLLGWAASVSGINLRNRITVKSRDARSQDIAVTVEDKQSIARYGPRHFTLFEPTMRTARLARRLANAIRRDYSWVQPRGAGVAAGDVFMRPGRVVTVVESGRTHSGPGQLYRVEGVVHHQTGHRHGAHTMALELRGYRHRAPSAPHSLVAAPLDGAAELDWALLADDPSVVGYRVHQSDTMAGSYSQVASTSEPPVVVDGLTNAQTYWFKVAGWTSSDVLGEFAGPVPCVPQTSGPPTQAEEAWQPQSLAAEHIRIWGMERPLLTWTPGIEAPAGTCYHIYRSQVSTGPFTLLATRSKPGAEPVRWIDYDTERLHGDLYYEVTFYNPSEGFESLPSSAAHISIP